jgi:alkanesulfonate monooxygenase SsuD/methylene tetrahydromethanopterin reductase-like flavin-dependent oxidoreductase (luciferase family)
VDIANELATVDQLSNGRLILQGATGHPTRDWDPLGVTTPISVSVRGRMMEEQIAIIRSLWASDEPLDFEGRYYTLTQARIGSRPLQQLPPIWLGIDRTYGRVGRLADGFTLTGTMWGGALDRYSNAVREIRRSAVAAGRDPSTIAAAARFAVVVDEDRAPAKERAEADWGALWGRPQAWYSEWAGDPDDVVSLIRPYVDAGATHVLVWPIPYSTADDTLRQLERFAKDVAPSLRLLPTAA